LDLLEAVAPPVSMDLLVAKVQAGTLEPQERKAIQVQLVLQAYKATQVLQVLQVQMVLQVYKVILGPPA
jgi:hypothetical protein